MRFILKNRVLGLVVLSLLCMLCTSSVYAQYYMKVFRNDGARVLFDVAAIDSVGVEETSDTQDSNYQLVIYSYYGQPSAYFSTNQVDSISYSWIDKDFTAASYKIETVSTNMFPYLSDDGWACVRFVTTPRNLLLNDDNLNKIRVSDLSGRPSEQFEIGDKEFQESDSTWQIKLRISSSSDTKASGTLSLVFDDIVVLSNAFTLESVSVRMKSVKITFAQNMTLDKKTNTYTACVPTTTNFSTQKFMFTHDGDSVTANGRLMVNKQFNVVDASSPVAVSLWKNGVHKDFTLKMTNSGLPVVRINTRGKTVEDRINWVDGAIMRIENPDGTVDFEDTLSLRGRGNGTWTETEKKPYALKLNKKAKILGMKKHKRWILLANYKDRTLLRNEAAFWLSRQTELPYTINGRYVELVWNGKHMGNYYLCEQAKIDKNRIDTYEPNLTDPAEGGYFVEIDAFLDYYSETEKKKEIGFWSSRFNLPYMFKDPDESEIDANSESFKYFRNLVDQFEAVLMDENKVKRHEYEKYIDVDKAIDYALIQELTLNHDAYNTWPKDGPHSAYMYVDTLGKLCYGPVWDFDYHTFMPTCNNGGKDLAKQWVVLNITAKSSTGRYYFSYLLKDSKFKNRLIERWDMYKDTWKELPAYIDTMADSIRVSESYNWDIWGLVNPGGDQNQDKDLGFQGAVNRMKQGFNARWEWIDVNIRKL